MLSGSIARQAAGLVGWVALMAVVAALGAVASVNAGDFYQSLERPDWAPPGSLFGPAWTTLYTLMAVAAWLVWRSHGLRNTALTLFLVQLVPNVLWSWLFFVGQMGAISFVNIVLLWGLILATLIGFWRLQRLAAMFLVPYLLWVSFAAALNLAVWQMNPNLLG